MKRFIAAFMAVISVFLLMPSMNGISASAAEEQNKGNEILASEEIEETIEKASEYNGFYYYKTSLIDNSGAQVDGLWISGFDSSVGKDVVIPSSIDGKPVVEIFIYNDPINDWCKSITSLTIPDSVIKAYFQFDGSKYRNYVQGSYGFCNLTTLNIGKNSKLECIDGLYGAKLDSIYIPAGVTEGELGLCCDYIKEVSLSPDNDDFIMNGEFLMSADGLRFIIAPLNSTVVIPDGTEEIYHDTLPRYSSYEKELIIPASVKEVDYYELKNQKCLEKITVEEGNEHYSSVDGVLLWGDGHIEVIPSALTEITISAEIKYLRSDSRSPLSQLATIKDDGTNERFFVRDNVLFEKRYDYEPGGSKITEYSLVLYPAQKNDSSYIVPENTYSIASDAFLGNKYLQSVVLPEGLEYIGVCAFQYCEKLADVNFPDSISEISCNVLSGTAYYENADNWENGILYCGKCLIDVNTEIEEAAIREDTKVIASGAFSCCKNISEISIPDSVIKIPSGAFESCANLREFTVGKNIESIDTHVFEGCKSLAKFKVESGNAAFSTDSYGALYNADKTELITYPSGSNTTEYTIGKMLLISDNTPFPAAII